MYCTTLYLLFTIFIKENNCKHQGLRIIGGTDAIEADFPYIAKYEYLIHIHKENNRVVNEHVCSGSVLTPTWSLTAAHCLDIKRKRVGKRYTVIPIIRYGTLESNAISNVLFSFTHPAYKHTRLNSVENDIGLVQTENIPLKQYGRVSALDFITMVGQQATVAGFGLTNSSDGTVDSTTKLKKPLQLLDVVVVHCKDNGLKPALCLARRCGKSSGVCPGDSGGPMLHASGIVGVNSIGPDDLELFCSMNETGPIYDAAGVTPTSPFIDWISNTINGHDKPEIVGQRLALRIMGGRDAIVTDYPYIVKLELQTVMYRVPKIVRNKHICTAGVLTSTWTITAAHCLTLKGKKVHKLISMGPVIRYGTLEHNAVSSVLFAITHPAYRLTKDRIQNDIGLVKTETIPLSQYARVSALDFTTMIGQEATLTGFGLTDNAQGDIGDATSVNKPLQVLDVVIVRCDKDTSVMKPSMCLARKCDKSSGMCPGDSGGPMIHASGIVGVNSLGPSELGTFCAKESTDPVYETAEVTPISPFIDWITDTTNDDYVP